MGRSLEFTASATGNWGRAQPGDGWVSFVKMRQVSLQAAGRA